MYNKKQNYRWTRGNNDETITRGVSYEYTIENQSCEREINLPFRMDAEYDYHPDKEVEEKFGKTYWKFYTSSSGAISLGTEDVLHTIEAHIEALKEMRATVKDNPNPKFGYQEYLENLDKEEELNEV